MSISISLRSPSSSMFLGEDKQAAGMLLGALRWSDENVRSRARFLNRPRNVAAKSSRLMGDDVGNDAGHDIGLAVDDDDALPPDEVEEVGVGNLIGKVVRWREQRDVFRNGAANADIDTARRNGRD